MSDIIIGRNAVIEAFDADVELEKVYVLATLRGEQEVAIRNLCRDHNIPLAKVPEQKLNELAKNRAHQGMVAQISPIKYQEYEDVIAMALGKGEQPLLVVLDGISDVRNIGAIARSALYFGAHGIIITGAFSGRINEDTIKASAGAILSLPVCRVNSLFNLISDLQSSGIRVIATALTQESILPQESAMHEPTAILMGSEDKGLHAKVLTIVDEVVKIPSASEFDSLNVSVAAAIILYNAYNQRHAQK
jgi:23S rRNA (guanosine2251-2'-O)-methyltransferase